MITFKSITHYDHTSPIFCVTRTTHHSPCLSSGPAFCLTRLIRRVKCSTTRCLVSCSYCSPSCKASDWNLGWLHFWELWVSFRFFDRMTFVYVWCAWQSTVWTQTGPNEKCNNAATSPLNCTKSTKLQVWKHPKRELHTKKIYTHFILYPFHFILTLFNTHFILYSLCFICTLFLYPHWWSFILVPTELMDTFCPHHTH